MSCGPALPNEVKTKEPAATKAILDPELRHRVLNLAQPLELCNDTGRILAQVIPTRDPSESLLEPQISAEEIRRRLAANERTYATAEVLACLEDL